MDFTEIWDYYQRGVDHHNLQNMYGEAERNHNFYIGNQWHGCKTGSEELPVLNFIKPVCRYKVSMIAQNLMSIVYNDMSGEAQKSKICASLTSFAATQWEKNKMDTLSWEIIKNSCITGDHYLYCYDGRIESGSILKDLRPKIKMKAIARTDIYFSNEQNPDINEQEYIIIAQRLPVNKVREIAKKNGLSAIDIEAITADVECENFVGEDKFNEVYSDLGKCTSLLFMQKTKEGLEFCRSVRQAIYEPMKVIKGLDVYPVAGMRWENLVGSARGVGTVRYMIPNQLEVNKTAARRAVVIKKFAFPIMAYDNARVSNPEDLSVAGAKVGVDNLENVPMTSIVQYLNPAPLSQDAEHLQQELMTLTRELEGAGDSATGQIDPTQASGEAIKAARDQAAIPLNEQINSYKQFVEDIALIWYKMWLAYSPKGLKITYLNDGENITEIIPHDMLNDLELDIRIDVSPVDPFSRLSQEMALERLMQSEHITFEEYINSLNNNSSVPKNRLLEIVKSRQSMNPDMMMNNLNSPEQMPPQMPMQMNSNGLPPIETLDFETLKNWQ